MAFKKEIIWFISSLSFYFLIAHSASGTCSYCLLIIGHLHTSHSCLHFLGSSAGKESAYDAGDSGSIPGLGRSPGEGTGYPLQCSWASLVAQMVKNPSAMWETWVWSLGWEDPLEEGMATHSSILAWRIPWTEEPGRLQIRGLQRVRHDWACTHANSLILWFCYSL